MNKNLKKLLQLLITSGCITTLVGCNSGGSEAGPTSLSQSATEGSKSVQSSIHENDLTFYYSGDLDGAVKVSFENAVKISKGQPYSGFESEILDDKKYGEYQQIRLLAGRKSSA